MRLFAAIELPQPVRRAVAAQIASLRDELPPATWVRADNLHLTLVFFGEVPDERAGELAEALAGAASAWERRRLRLSGAGGFPPRGPVRVVWLGVEPEPSLAALAQSLRHAARRASFEFDDKPFRSHLTVARCRRPWPALRRADLLRLLPPEAIDFEATHASLVASELAAGGSRYRAVRRLPLREVA
ncbi:MAG TPA: RNA 2',3'-cyclic phosphodiesterase [Thermoanaerobaculia bacterium]